MKNFLLTTQNLSLISLVTMKNETFPIFSLQSFSPITKMRVALVIVSGLIIILTKSKAGSGMIVVLVTEENLSAGSRIDDKSDCNLFPYYFTSSSRAGQKNGFRCESIHETGHSTRISST